MSELEEFVKSVRKRLSATEKRCFGTPDENCRKYFAGSQDFTHRICIWADDWIKAKKQMEGKAQYLIFLEGRTVKIRHLLKNQITYKGSLAGALKHLRKKLGKAL